MKKLLKNKLLKSICLILIGIIIGGSIGITAVTYVLKSNEIQYKDNKSVQEAIDELFVKAENCGRSNETLPIGTIVSEGFKVIIPYTGSYSTIGCVYGTDEKYGSVGTINNNTCIFTGTSSNQKLYYKISALTTDGKTYEYIGSTATGASGVTIVKTGLPKGVKAIVYLDPTNLGTVCNEQNSSVGGNAKSGCMKWYAYKEDNTSYTMILDHNTTKKIAMKEVQTTLTSDTVGWNGNPRLITGQEVADITGNTSFSVSSTTSSGWFYLDSNSQTQTAKSTGASSYYWLYDYTSECIFDGCKVADSSTYGYWTSTPVCDNSDDAWRVDEHGCLSVRVYAAGHGVRPVITIQKSSL